MRIYFTIIYVIGILLVKNSVSGKTLIFGKYSNGPQSDARKQDDVAFDNSKDNYDDNSDEAAFNSYKRSANENMKASKRNAYEVSVRKRSPYGLVYNQGKPIGILEPISQSFEFSGYAPPKENSFRNGMFKSQWFPVKRESDIDMDEIDKEQLESQTTALHSSNYPNVLAKFKVNNKVKHRPYQDYLNSQTKRSTSLDLNRRKDADELKKRGALDMGDIKANLNAKKGSNAMEENVNKLGTSKIDEIEENLKDVMGDMGLVEKDKELEARQENQVGVKKREIYFEDEDLENGLNKIGLTKESHADLRNKKEDCPGKTKIDKSRGSKKFLMEKSSLHRKGKKKIRKEDEANAKRSVKANRKRVAIRKDSNGVDITKRKVANYQYEGEDFIRRKRQGKEAEKADSSEIMKGLESSGDLTVSGNKSPLVAISSTDDADLKKIQEKRDKEELDYEKRLERNIQEKINTIKEEVKREITKIKSDEAKKEQQRKKREASSSNTLLDGESSILDPRVNIDSKLEPHIRKRRDAIVNQDKDKREVDKNTETDKVANVQATETAQIEKRSDDKSVAKVEENSANTAKKSEDGDKEKEEIVKRSNDQTVNKGELSDKAQNIDKRSDSFTATDKIETNNKAEFGTDIPDSIVKRNDQTAVPIIDKVEAVLPDSVDVANIAKRSEEATDKTIDNVAAAYKKMDADNDLREDRSAAKPSIVDLQTGQTILKDIDFEDNKDNREERQSSIAQQNSPHSSSIAKAPTQLEGEQDGNEEVRDERSSNKLKQPNVRKQSHHKLKRNDENDRSRRANKVDNAKISEQIAEKKISLLNPEENEVSIDELKHTNMKQRDLGNEENNLEPANVKERSTDEDKFDLDDNTDDKLADAVGPDDNAKISESHLENSEIEVADDLGGQIAIDKRRRRRAASNRHRLRQKRDESSYSENQPELLNFRADDGEIDDEDDEMHDDGFDDQSYLAKRHADYYNDNNYENLENQDVNEDYPTFIERNKRNALRLYDDENDAEESNDNFLFYPNRYSRTKRHSSNYDMALHGGSMTNKHAAARGREQNLRRKRLEKMNRMHGVRESHDNENVAELSESDIFGGFPQSYEGELSRFKRVKRSIRD